ncbi:hypothetical protein [Nocardia pneumoniae]|uniref:hypothetical protein n=1 Tax=Nocardia pneumoniae TaxID=228601 RepID=UPI000594041F|nr:hypothetical protein [Nocardia pneumoniae]
MGWTLPLLATGVGALALRHRMLHWGATPAEVAGEYPGDMLVPAPTGCSTMATTLEAPPEEVWRWLVQMGADRAGWYSWDRLDNGGRPSSTRIVPEWQELREGDRVNATVDGRMYFTVAIADRPTTLVLRSDLALPSGRPFDPRGPLPRMFTQGVWGFHLTELPGGRTRLVVRTIGRDAPRPLMSVADFLLGQPAHLIMQARQFANLRRRIRADENARIDTSVADSTP